MTTSTSHLSSHGLLLSTLCQYPSERGWKVCEGAIYVLMVQEVLVFQPRLLVPPLRQQAGIVPEGEGMHQQAMCVRARS